MQMNVCADLGASELKVIYQLEKNRPCGICLLPNVLEVSSGQVNIYSQTKMPISENIAWLKLRSNAAEVMAVDQLAENIFSISNHQQLKINSADWRILAIIGKIITIEQEKFSTSLDEVNFKLNLIVLLPYGEFNKKEIRLFRTELKKKLRKFYHNDIKRVVDLENVKVLPEGVGSLMCCPNRRRMIIIMLGHRNTSYLYFENDKFINGKSVQLGFYSLVKAFCDKTSGQEENHLTTMALWKSRLNLNELRKISKTQRPEFQVAELQTLTTAFNESKKELWTKIKQWLLKELDTLEFDTMQFTGGVAEFLRPLIVKDEPFKHLPLEFAGNQYSETVKESLNFPGLRDEKIEELTLRLVDCYGAFTGVF